MLILGIESSGERAAACLLKDGKIIVNIEGSLGLTHSETLLPIINNVFTMSKEYEVKNLDIISVSAGPGSFTGLRIGMAIAKGLAAPYNIKIENISTLEALRYNVFCPDRVVIPIMDARCDRVFYNIKPYIDDTEDDISNFVKKVNEIKEERVIFVGDACDVYAENIKSNLKKDFLFTPMDKRYQSAVSVAFLAYYRAISKEQSTIEGINYLVKPQAEKELDKKMNQIMENKGIE